MQSRRDQVEAQTYLLSRLTGALVSAQPDGVEPPTRRDLRGLIGSAMIALVCLGVVAAFALFSSSGSTAWKQADTLIIDKNDGSRYLYLNGLLRPVKNLASAKLITQGRLSTASVKSSVLADVPRGDAIGVDSGPDTLPDAGLLNSGVWRVCATSAAARFTSVPTIGLVTDIGATAAHARLGSGDGMLVTAAGRGTFLLWQGHSLKLGKQSWVDDVLGWSNVTPIEVDANWLDLIPAGPGLAPDRPAAAGEAGPRIDGHATRIGQIFQSPTQTYYLLRKSGLTPLGQTRFLLDSAGNGQGATMITAQGLASAPRGKDPIDTGMPQTPPRVQAQEATMAPCLEYPGRSSAAQGDLVWAALPTDAHATATTTATPATPATPAGAVTGNSVTPDPASPTTAVRVAPNAGELIAVPAAAAGADPSYVLVNDTGTAYPLAGKDEVSDLGYDKVPAVSLDPALTRLLPAGPLLSAAELS